MKPSPQKGVPKVFWTTRQLELVRELYPNTPNAEIAAQVGHSVKSVVAEAHRMGLKKSPERLRQMGVENVRLRKDRRSA